MVAQSNLGSNGSAAKVKVEHWRALCHYWAKKYFEKTAQFYFWDKLQRKNLYFLTKAYAPWEVMAMIDLYLEKESVWSRRTRRSIYGMTRDAGRLMDDGRFKFLSRKHENELAGAVGGFKPARLLVQEVMRSIGP